MYYTSGCHCGAVRFQVTLFDGKHWEEQIKTIEGKYS